MSLSWESLDRTRERTSKELNASLEELPLLVAKIERLRRTLKLAEARANKKASCLQEELFLEDQQTWRSKQSVIMSVDPSLPLEPLLPQSMRWLETFDFSALEPDCVGPGGTAAEASGS